MQWRKNTKHKTIGQTVVMSSVTSVVSPPAVLIPINTAKVYFLTWYTAALTWVEALLAGVNVVTYKQL